MTAYQSVFTSRDGGLYEMDQTRSAIHAFATHCSKLKPHVVNTADKRLERALAFRPNPWENTSQFLARTATILEVENTVFLAPILNERGDTVGAFPVLPSSSEVVTGPGGALYLRFHFRTGQTAAIEWERVGVLTKMQYKDDFFGESNQALANTLDLIDVQNQGIQNGIKQAAAVRFMAKLGNSVRPDALKAERDAFTQMNLSAENNGGVMIFDAKYAEVRQIDSKPFVVDADQMKLINQNVWSYFGTNEAILQNTFDEKTWAAYYESRVEPFAIQLSLAMTAMFFTPKQIAMGIELQWSANRLQFASTSDKINIVTQLFDRGMLSRDEGREIMQMPPLPDGQGAGYYIRGEYVESEKKQAEPVGSGMEDNNADD